MKCYVHYFFTILLQQILSGRLLLVVIGGQKSNSSCGFKLELITTYQYHLLFVIKVLWKYCRRMNHFHCFNSSLYLSFVNNRLFYDVWCPLSYFLDKFAFRGIWLLTNWPCIFGEDFLGLVMYISGEGLTDRASIVNREAV